MGVETQSLIGELVAMGEAVTGSREAHALAERLERLLEEASSSSVSRIRLPVATWRDEGGWVECGSLRVEAKVLPQTLGGSASGRLVEVHCTTPRCFAHVSPGDVVIARLPEDPDDVTTLYVNALEAGASALLVYDRWPGRYRRIVVSGRWDYSLNPSPAPMPALHLRMEDGLRLLRHCLGSRVSVDSSARLSTSTGVILETIVGSGDWEVVVMAHYDHWLTGAGDNLAGVAALLEAARMVRGLSGVRVRLLLLDAEEFGDPLLPAWYWAYGSRWYAEELKRAGLLDEILAVVNLEMPVRSRLYVAGTPEVRGVIARLAGDQGFEVVEEEYETCYSDGYSFARLGVPSTTIYNIEDYIEWYHTDLDTPERIETSAVRGAARLAAEFVRLAAERGPRALNYEAYLLALESLYEHAPLQARRGLYVFTEEARRKLASGSHETVLRAFRLLNARLGACVFHDDYKWGSGGFRPTLAPWLRVALEEARRVRTRSIGPGDAVVPGDEEHLPVATPMPVKLWAMARGGGLGSWWEALDEAMRVAVARAAERLDELLREAYEELRSSR